MGLTIEVKLFLASLNLVVIVEISLSIYHGISFSIFLLILPDREGRVLLINILVILGVHCHCGIGADVLAQCLLNHALNRKLFARLDQHLSGCATVLHELEERVIGKRYALLLVVENLFAG